MKANKNISARQKVISLMMLTIIVTTTEELEKLLEKTVSKAFEKYKIQSTTQDELLTIKEVCALVKRSASWLQRCDELKPVSTGKRNVRFSGKQVNEYLNQLRKK